MRRAWLALLALALPGCPSPHELADVTRGDPGPDRPGGFVPSDWDLRPMPGTDDGAFVFAKRRSLAGGKTTVAASQSRQFRALELSLPDAFAFAPGPAHRLYLSHDWAGPTLAGIISAVDLDAAAVLWRSDRLLRSRALVAVKAGVIVQGHAGLVLLDAATGAARGSFPIDPAAPGLPAVAETADGIVVARAKRVDVAADADLAPICSLDVPEMSEVRWSFQLEHRALLAVRRCGATSCEAYTEVVDPAACALATTLAGSPLAAAGTRAVTLIDRLAPSPLAPYPAEVQSSNARYHLLVHDLAAGKTAAVPLADTDVYNAWSPDASRALFGNPPRIYDVAAGAFTLVKDPAPLCPLAGVYPPPLSFDPDGAHVAWLGQGLSATKTALLARVDTASGAAVAVELPGQPICQPQLARVAGVLWIEQPTGAIDVYDPVTLASLGAIAP